jgi:AAA domain
MSRDPLMKTVATYKKRLKTDWHEFDNLVALRPEIAINLFSTPGMGKSMLALNMMKRVTDPAINRHPPGVLYITLDTPMATQANRWWALNCGVPIETVEKAPHIYRKKNDRLRKGHGWVEWNDHPITVDDLQELMLGIKEYTDSYPGLVIVDVIKDLLEEGSYEEFNHAFKKCKEMAMGAKVTVVTLHHAIKATPPDKLLHLREVEYAGDKQPDVVLGLYTKKPDHPNMLVLKNRSGIDSGNGDVGFQYDIHWELGGQMTSHRFRRLHRS